MIRQNGRITKKIRWSAFTFTDRDWEWVKDARDILKVGRLRPRRPPATSSTAENEDAEKNETLLSEYDRYCQTLMDMDDHEGWASELWHFLKDRPADVTKDTDIVKWWQVCFFHSITGFVSV